MLLNLCGQLKIDFKIATCLSCQPTRDEFGAAIALFTARLHHPTQSSHQSVLKALIFQLDVALERFVECGNIILETSQDLKYLLCLY